MNCEIDYYKKNKLKGVTVSKKEIKVIMLHW